MKDIKIILDLLNKKEKKQLILILFLLIIMGFLELLGVGSVGPFISLITNPNIINNNTYLKAAYSYFDFSNETSFIITFGIATILLIAVSNLFFIFVNFILNYYSGKTRYSIATRFLEKYLRQPYIFYLTINTSTLTKNIMDDINTIVTRILLWCLNLASSFIISFFIILLLIIINPLLAFTISGILGISYLIIFSFVRYFLIKKGKEREIQNKYRFKYINEIFNGIKDIKILGKEQVFLKYFSDVTKKHSMNDVMYNFINENTKYIFEAIAIGSLLGIIIFMISSGSNLEIFLPILTIYTFGAYRLLPSLQNIFKAIASIKYYLPILQNLHNDYALLPDGRDLPSEDIPRISFDKEIQLKNIFFHYPNIDNNIIKDQNLIIKANTSIGIVGPTGCGKTTLVDIILGLLEPQNGKILIDDTEVTDENLRNWQKNLGYVPQSIFLSDDTIRRNIAFGIPSEKIDDDAVIFAARLANIHDFIINDLEEGYNTIIGERGIRLSGGQRQRIGIARATYHDPPVLIFDEATSSLDTLTENVVIEAINNLNHKKTIIIIAHRLTTVKYCDIIYLMNNGTIVDSGTYDKLYTNNKSFKRLADGK